MRRHLMLSAKMETAEWEAATAAGTRLAEPPESAKVDVTVDGAPGSWIH